MTFRISKVEIDSTPYPQCSVHLLNANKMLSLNWQANGVEILFKKERNQIWIEKAGDSKRTILKVVISRKSGSCINIK